MAQTLRARRVERAAALAIGLGLVAAPAPAEAATNWTCDASAALLAAGSQRLEPLRANAAGPACAGDDQRAASTLFREVSGLGAAATAHTAYARTTLAGGALSADNVATSESGVERLDVTLGGGQLRIGVDVAFAAVDGRCTSGTPTYASSGRVAGLRINGQEVTADAQLEQLTDAISGSPLGGVVTVRLNKVRAGAGGLTREAVRIEMLAASGAPVASLVIGRAAAGADGDVCARPDTTTPGSGTTVTTLITGLTSTLTAGAGAGTAAGTLGASARSGPRPNGNNASACARLTMFFVDRRPRRRAGGRRPLPTGGPATTTSRFGRRMVTRGTLRNCAGRPITAARVDVYHLINGQRRRLVKTGMRSRTDGRLTLILPMNLTGRQLQFEYRPFLDRRQVAARRALRLRVVDARGLTVTLGRRRGFER